MAAKSTSARRALRVLKCLKGHTLHGLANNEIAKALDDSAVNISRALDVLMDEGWVSRLETGRYALSITALQVAQAHADEVARAMAIIQETTQRIHAGAQI